MCGFVDIIIVSSTYVDPSTDSTHVRCANGDSKFGFLFFSSKLVFATQSALDLPIRFFENSSTH